MSSDAPPAEREPDDKPFPPHLSVAGGLLMGGADAIPGVSGGTIALIIGIYERFIAALEVAVKTPVLIGSPAGRRRLAHAFGFLVPLGVGVVVAYYLATKLLVGATDDPGILRQDATAPACYAFFFGLVLASITQPWKRISERGPGIGIAAAAGFIAAFVFTGLPYQSATATWTLLWGGAGAVSVMLLPGVSGSLFLLIVGQYHLVVTAVHDRDAAVLAVFLGGLVLGVVLFVPVLRLLLARRHDLTMAALTGLMAGSLRALWPWKSGYDPKLAPMTNIAPLGSTLSYVWVALGLVAGVAVVYLLARLERRMSRAD